jgi:hypothetical protein
MVPTSLFLEHKEKHFQDLKRRQGITPTGIGKSSDVNKKTLAQLDSINPNWRIDYGVSIPVFVDDHTIRLPIRIPAADSTPNSPNLDVNINYDISYNKGSDLYDVTATAMTGTTRFDEWQPFYHNDGLFWDQLEENIKWAIKEWRERPVVVKAISGGIVDKFDQFYEENLSVSGPKGSTPTVAGVKISEDLQSDLFAEWEGAKKESDIMPKGMTDPIDWSLANYLPILWDNNQNFNGYIDKKPEAQTNEFPTGNYKRDYAVVKTLTEKWHAPRTQRRSLP